MSKPSKRSVSIKGHQTSFSLEDEFWDELLKISNEMGLPRATLVTKLDEERDPEQNLSSTIRVFVLNHLKSKLP